MNNFLVHLEAKKIIRNNHMFLPLTFYMNEFVCDLGSQTQINEVDKMLSLLEVNFHSREELLVVVHKIEFKEGYVTVIRRSKADKCVFIGSDRGGKYRDTRMVSLEKRKRKTTSRLLNCPFEIVGRRKPEGFWKVEIKNFSHNHEPSRDMSGHPYCR